MELENMKIIKKCMKKRKYIQRKEGTMKQIIKLYTEF